MCPRAYRMQRRTETAEQTRQRIVRATYELHAEKGIAATSVRDIALRADVAVGTVYHHFPSYDDVLNACGAFTLALARPPDMSIFEGIDSAAGRLQALVDALFAFYARFPGFERVRADRDKFARLETFIKADETQRRALLDAALVLHKVGKRRKVLAFAMLDVVVYRTLVAEGLSQADAVREITAMLQQCLLGETRE